MQWRRIQTSSYGGGPALIYLPSRLFSLQSFLLFSPKIREDSAAIGWFVVNVTHLFTIRL